METTTLSANENILNEKNRASYVADLLSYAKYADWFCSLNALPNYVSEFSKSHPLQENHLTTKSSFDEFVASFENYLINKFESIDESERNTQPFYSFSGFIENDSFRESFSYEEEDASTIIEEQELMSHIKDIQSRRPLPNSFSCDDPSVFVFVRFDHRENLFAYTAEIDPEHPEIVYGLEGVDTIFDLPERVETVFMIKEGYFSLNEIRTGNYNELISPETIRELKVSLNHRHNPPYPFFLDIAIPEQMFNEFDCTKKMCSEFLSGDSNRESALRLIELDTTEIKPFLPEELANVEIFCDAKDENILYSRYLSSDIYRFDAPVFTDTASTFAITLSSMPLTKISELRGYSVLSDEEIAQELDFSNSNWSVKNKESAPSLEKKQDGSLFKL